MAVTCVPIPPLFFDLPLRQIILPFIGRFPDNSQILAINPLQLKGCKIAWVGSHASSFTGEIPSARRPPPGSREWTTASESSRPEPHPGCCGPRPSRTTSRVPVQNARPRARDLPTCSIQQTELCYCYDVEKGKYLPGAIAAEFMDHAQWRSCERFCRRTAIRTQARCAN